MVVTRQAVTVCVVEKREGFMLAMLARAVLLDVS